MDTGHWIVNCDLIESPYGFIYKITNLCSNKKYIGKKQIKTVLKRKPLKGKKNKRHRRVETDWREYYGSSDALNSARAEIGNQHFKRKILYWCANKNQMSYFEAREQFARDVLFKDEYYNGIISCRISSRGLKP